MHRNHTLCPESISNNAVVAKSVLDRFEVTGTWQFDNHKQTICGNITYDKHDGVILHITHFRNDSNNNGKLLSMIRHPWYQRVIGNLTTGEVAVLEDVTEIEYHTSSRGLITKSYRIDCMYVGENLITSKFNQICVSYTSLFTWLAPSLHKITESHGDIDVHIIPEKNVKVCLDEFDMSIGCVSNIEDGGKNLSVQHRAIISMKLKGLHALGDLYKLMRCFHNFLMFATSTTVQPISVVVANNDGSYAVFDNQRKYDDIVNEQDDDKLNFSYRQIQNNFEEIVRGWFRLSKQYCDVLDRYFQTWLDERFMDVELVFLRFCTALEGFYKTKFPKCTKTYKEGLVYLLQNTYTVIDSNDICEFAEMVTNTRNFHAHGKSKNGKEIITNTLDLAWVVRKLDLIMYGCIIMELKMPEPLKSKIMDKKIKRLEDDESYDRRLHNSA